MVLQKTLLSLLDCKEIQPVHPKGNQTWIFIGKTDAEAESPILLPPEAKSWLIGKAPDAGKDWRLKAGEGDDRGWDGWMASPAQWTWVWASSRSTWTELNWGHRIGAFLVKMIAWIICLVSARNTSTKVFIFVWGLIEHRSYLILMIIKQCLSTTKTLTTEKWFTAQYSPR